MQDETRQDITDHGSLLAMFLLIVRVIQMIGGLGITIKPTRSPPIYSTVASVHENGQDACRTSQGRDPPAHPASSEILWRTSFCGKDTIRDWDKALRNFR